MNEITQNFQFQDHQLRTFMDEKGELWFIAMDVAKILEYSDAHEMTKRLDDDETQNRQLAGFGNRGVTTINESGLYAAILTSRKPEAKSFKRWVTHEVLPSIRKHGHYGQPPTPYDDTPPESSLPLHRVSSALLGELRRMSKSLAQVYLLECGVTPAYISGQLALLDGNAVAGLEDRPDNAMPIELFKQDMLNHIDHQDDRYYYFKRDTFKKLCGDYDPSETARRLRDHKLLKHYRHTLTVRVWPPKSKGKGKRMQMYAVNKAILEY